MISFIIQGDTNKTRPPFYGL